MEELQKIAKKFLMFFYFNIFSLNCNTFSISVNKFFQTIKKIILSFNSKCIKIADLTSSSPFFFLELFSFGKKK